ncbi:hypothetical protein GGR57DRAFT_473975 [Xylariaceae sp. FL1272]|nr:hypothetical protein GGR57DRAFT_473975 [Xylariaceae sp. FL1272]
MRDQIPAATQLTLLSLVVTLKVVQPLRLRLRVKFLKKLGGKSNRKDNFNGNVSYNPSFVPMNVAMRAVHCQLNQPYHR